ncbi:MAG: transposase [Chitinophagaceae bacterium]|nr:transposase [Chitinophagaceae bacterium]
MQATPIINYKEAYEALVLKYDDVMQELAVLKKMVFGSKSERFIPTDESKVDPQLSLELDAEIPMAIGTNVRLLMRRYLRLPAPKPK